MSKLLNQLAGQSEDAEPTPPPKAQQLDLLGPLPVSIKDPPSITASIPPRNHTLTRARNKPQAEPMLTPPEEMDKLHAALADAEARGRAAEEQANRIRSEADARAEQVRSENEDRLESLRLEIMSLQDSREAERKSRLAGEQRIRELEEQISATPAVTVEDSIETRQALDEAQTQLDDLRSQFRHVESSHEQQAHQAELRVKELTAILDREKKAQTELQHEAARKQQALVEQNRNLTAALEKAGQELIVVQRAASDRESALQQELQAARMEAERVAAEAQAVPEEEPFSEELIQARVRIEELETRLCSEAELRGRAERNASEVQSRQAEAAEARIREADLQVRQLTDALETVRREVATVQRLAAEREQEAARLQERERLSAQRVAALRRVESPATSRVPTRALSALPLPWPIFLVLIVIACGSSFLLGRWQGAGRQGPDTARMVTPSSPTTGPSVARPTAPKPVQWPVLKGNFMRVQPGTDRMTVVFEYAVFSRRTEIHPDALRDLQKLARQLAPLTAGFRFEITGHTDADPVSSKAGEYSNNLDLGLKRSQAVRDVLIRQGGLPAEALTAVSAGELNPPYPNTTDELRKKNRTVTIALIPK